MKKLLSVLLAVLMIFSVMSVSASAAHFTSDGEAQVKANANQFVAKFDCNGSTTKNEVEIYDSEAIATGYFKTAIGEGIFYLVPRNDTQYLINGGRILLPSVNGTSTHDFRGWYCYNTKDTYAGNTEFTAQTSMFTDNNRVLSFKADFEPKEIEQDTMSTIIDILCRIFGAILGILMFDGDTARGVEQMKQILGGVLG